VIAFTNPSYDQLLTDSTFAASLTNAISAGISQIVPSMGTPATLAPYVQCASIVQGVSTFAVTGRFALQQSGSTAFVGVSSHITSSPADYTSMMSALASGINDGSISLIQAIPAGGLQRAQIQSLHKSSGSSLSSGAIAGIVVGCVVAMIILVVLFCVCCIRWGSSKPHEAYPPHAAHVDEEEVEMQEHETA